jgi:hypothetical protein
MPQIPVSRVKNLRPPRVDFSWAPLSTLASITIGGNSYPYSSQADAITRSTDTRYAAYRTPTNTLLTFTATVEPFEGAVIVRYRWDFGDGTEAYGPTTTKTYRVSNQTAQASLQVLDSNGMTATATHALNLVKSTPTRWKFTRL